MNTRLRKSLYLGRCRSAMPLLLVLVGQLVSYAPMLSTSFQFNQFNRHDTESFLALAHSIAHGRGYTTSLDPSFYQGHTHFPPGFQVLLAWCFWLSDSLLLPQLVVVAFSLGNSILFWILSRQFLSRPVACAALVLFVTSPVYDQLSTVVMSEQPTVFFGLLSLWTFSRWREEHFVVGRWFYLSCLSLGSALLVRGLLLPLLPAYWLYSWFSDADGWRARIQNVLRTSVFLVIALLPTIAWELRNSTVDATGFEGMRHTDYILRGGNTSGPILQPWEFGAMAFRNLKWFVPARLLDSFAGVSWALQTHFDVSLSVISRCAILLFFGGSCMLAFRNFPRMGYIVLYLLLSIVLLLVYNVGGAERYWLQIYPALLIVVFSVLQSLSNSMGLFKSSGATRLSLAAVCSFAVAILVVDHAHREPQYGKVWNSFIEICNRAGDVVPEDGALMSPHSIAARLSAGRLKLPTEALFLDRSGETIHTSVPVFVLVPVEDPQIAPEWNNFRQKIWTHSWSRNLVKTIENDSFVLYQIRP